MFGFLPMYDLSELRPSTDTLWSELVSLLRRSRSTNVLPQLRRGSEDLWLHPDLLLGQTCGLPLTTVLEGRVEVVARATYRAEGCSPGMYCSRIIVPQACSATSIVELEGPIAVNDFGSHSGWNALLGEVAQAQRARLRRRAVVTGSHRASIAAVKASKAELAAVDCVTWSLLADVAPTELAGIRTLGWTRSAPSLPFVTSHPSLVGPLRKALGVVVGSASDVCQRLRISSIIPATRRDYDAIVDYRV